MPPKFGPLTALQEERRVQQARVELKHLIRILAEEGKTVFISSHILSELDEMCDSLLFINQYTIPLLKAHFGAAFHRIFSTTKR